MKISEDKRGLALFLVPALWGWLQIIVALLAALIFGHAVSGVVLVMSIALLVVVAILVARDGHDWGIDTGGFIAGIVLLFIVAYPLYMARRASRGAAVGGIAGVLAMFFFFLPLVVLPLGAGLLAKHKTETHTSHVDPRFEPMPIGSRAAPPATSHENKCTHFSCDIYYVDSTTLPLLSSPEHQSAKVTLHAPKAEWFTELAKLKTLRRLTLSDAKGFDDLSPLSTLTSLEELEIWNTGATTLAPLAPLVALESLSIFNDDELVDVSVLPKLPNLKALEISVRRLKSLDDVGGAAHLRKAKISMPTVPLDALAALTSVDDLKLRAMSQSLKPLAKMTSLRALDLWSCTIKDPSELGALTSLERLELGGAHELKTIAFASKLTRLQYLDVDYLRELQDLTPLRGHPTLTDLEASGTAIEDLAPLATLPRLTRLNLDKTKITSLAPLASVKTLRTLSIRGTAVHDLMPLAKLPELKSISIDQGQIPDAAMSAFKAAAPGVSFYVSKP